MPAQSTAVLHRRGRISSGSPENCGEALGSAEGCEVHNPRTVRRLSSPTSDYTESPGRIARFGYPAWGLTSGPHHWELACSSLGEPACVRMGYPRAAQTLPGVGALEDRHRSAAGCQSPGDLPLDPDGPARS